MAIRGDRASDHNNLCGVYLKKGDFENALEETTNALNCDRKFLPAWASRIEIHVKEKDLDKATKCVVEMIAIDANSPDTIRLTYDVGRQMLSKNRSDDAIAFSANQ